MISPTTDQHGIRAMGSRCANTATVTLVCVITLAAVCGGSVLAVGTNSAVARVEVADRPNYRDEPYRYVLWNGESYGPSAFVSIARHTITSIVLVKPTDAGRRCIAAVAAEMPARAEAMTSDGVTEPLAASTESVKDACTIKRETPRPVLPTGYYYVVADGHRVAIEGEPPIPPPALVERLTEIRAKAIVLREVSIGAMLCFGAVARAADVDLYEVGRDGSLDPQTISGATLGNACNW